MAYSYDRTASVLSKLLASRHIDRVWNQLHLIEAALQDAAHEYDVAASYSGKKGERQAKAVLKAIDDVREKIEDLVGSDKAFDKMWQVELKFNKEFGTPEAYSAATRAEIYPR